MDHNQQEPIHPTIITNSPQKNHPVFQTSHHSPFPSQALELGTKGVPQSDFQKLKARPLEFQCLAPGSVQFWPLVLPFFVSNHAVQIRTRNIFPGFCTIFLSQTIPFSFQICFPKTMQAQAPKPHPNHGAGAHRLPAREGAGRCTAQEARSTRAGAGRVQGPGWLIQLDWNNP